MVWAAATGADGLAGELAVGLDPGDLPLLVERAAIADAAGTVADGVEDGESEESGAGLSAPAESFRPGFGDPDSEITTTSSTIAPTAHPARNSQLGSRRC